MRKIAFLTCACLIVLDVVMSSPTWLPASCFTSRCKQTSLFYIGPTACCAYPYTVYPGVCQAKYVYSASSCSGTVSYCGTKIDFLQYPNGAHECSTCSPTPAAALQFSGTPIGPFDDTLRICSGT